jgi:molybdopterin-guanine dinucleotide biosynthesis protein A
VAVLSLASPIFFWIRFFEGIVMTHIFPTEEHDCVIVAEVEPNLRFERMDIAGVIIAGGKGTRLGGGKPLRPFGMSTLLDAVVARVRPQVEELALNVSVTDRERYLDRGVELLTDGEAGDIGPLAGILASLEWAERRGAKQLATFPADTPFLPRDLVRRLLQCSGGAVAAHDGERLHGLCAIWPIDARAELRRAVREEGVRSLRHAISHVGGKECVIDGPPHAFFNVNTPDDLATAERILAEIPELG